MDQKNSVLPRKALYALGGGLMILAVVLGGAALGISDAARDQAVEALLWLSGLVIGGHALTDAAASRR